MATIKSYTTIEQSRKLAKILSLESADMYYISGDECDICFGSGVYEEIANWLSNGTPKPADIPCWSLAALLNYLKNKNKFPEIKELSDGRFKLTTYIWDGKDCIQVSIGDSIVDTCYELILKLHELKML